MKTTIVRSLMAVLLVLFSLNSSAYIVIPSSITSGGITYHGSKGGIMAVAPSTNITFADANVKALCVDNWDTNNDGEFSEDEAAAVTDLGTVFKNHTQITSFDELQYFTGLTSIGNYAFYGCSGLTSVTIPNSVTSISDYAFSYCKGLNSVTIEDGTETLLFSISGADAYSRHFASCPIEKLYLGRNIRYSYSQSPFKGNQQLTSVTFGNSVTTIGDNAFYGCSGITTLNFPNSVTKIGSSAFRECKGLNSVTIGNNVTSIGDNAFYGCSGITTLNIPNSIILIRENAFSGCSGLTTLNIPNSVTTIGENAFSGCSGLTTLNIPNSVTTIGKSAFSGCKGLNSVTIEDGTETLSFDNTSNGYPFSSCPIEKLYLGRNISYSPSYSPFRGNQQLTSVIIGNNVTSIGESAFNGCRGLTALNIPNSVTTIGKSAFSGCI